MIQRFAVSLLLVVWLISVAGAQTPAPPGVSVKLSFAENKTVYRIGEEIKLVMEFTADREGYVLDSAPERSEPGTDTVVVSPDIGLARWYDELSDNSPYGRHVHTSEKLTNSPHRIEISINDRLRFDSAGRYTVSVTTRRVSPISTGRSQLLSLSTNSLNFEIQSMSEADEAKEVKLISDLLDGKRNSSQFDVLSKRLSYLTGDPSTREKVRRFLIEQQVSRSGSSSHIWFGLFIARNRALVLKLVESALRDPNIPATSGIIYAATRLKTLLTHGVREKPVNPEPGRLEREQHPRAREIQDAYLAELSAGLAKRTGDNQTTTAVTILTLASADSQTTNAGIQEARRILVQQFDTLQLYIQQWLLHSHWDAIRDSAVIPSLKKMMATSDMMAGRVKTTALQRLLELAPDEARPYVIAEIRDFSSPVDTKILGTLKDESLPEVDAALLEQIRRGAAATQYRDLMYLKSKVHLLVRFATDSIYQELMELYRTTGDKLEVDTRAGLLAYFVKHNEREGIQIIEQIVSELKPRSDPRILGQITALYYSDAIGVILKKLLETDDYAHASHAALSIARHGAPGDELVLEARLKRWRAEWRDRAAEAEAQHQGQLERSLIFALLVGKSWKLTPLRLQELQRNCITKACRQSNLVTQ